MGYTTRLNNIRHEVILYITLMTKSYKKIIIKGKCVLEFRHNQVMHSNVKTQWRDIDINDKRYTTDYLCKIADAIYRQLNTN